MATGYGQDTWCGDSLVTGRLARGVTNVVLSYYRRLTTARGTLRGLDDENKNEDELTFGFDLAELCGETDPETAVKIVPPQIRAELMKDDRSLDVNVIAHPPAYDSEGLATLVFDVEGILVDAGENFRFTVTVEGATVSLLIGGT